MFEFMAGSHTVVISLRKDATPLAKLLQFGVPPTQFRVARVGTKLWKAGSGKTGIKVRVTIKQGLGRMASVA